MSSEAFWTWFSAESERLFHAVDASAIAVVEEVGDALREHHPGVFCELPAKPEGANQTRMIFTPDGDVDLIETVRRLVATAPDLERWTFVPFRQRSAVGGSIKMKGVTLEESDVFYRTFSGPRGELWITLVIRGLTEDEDDPRAMLAILLMDHLIGELDSLTLIDSLAREPLEDEGGEGLRPLATLPDLIDSYKDSGLDSWDCYRTEIDGEGTVAFVTVKLGLGAVTPIAGRPTQVRVIVPFVNPREDGLISDKEEVELLWLLEDELRSALAESCDAISVGRVTTSGTRHFVFYAAEGQMVEAHAQRVFAAYLGHELWLRTRPHTSGLVGLPTIWDRRLRRRPTPLLQYRGRTACAEWLGARGLSPRPLSPPALRDRTRELGGLASMAGGSHAPRRQRLP